MGELMQKYYDKMKNCLLPVKILENDKYKIIINENNVISECSNYYEGFKDIIGYELYYSFDIKNKHHHTHSFEEVIENVYKYPETFKINKNDYKLYSNQELKYLKRLQKFLMFYKLKDIEDYNENIMIERIKNSNIKKYIHLKQFNSKYANAIINKNLKKEIFTKYNEYFMDNYEALLIDEDYNILGVIKILKEKIKLNEVKENDINYRLLGYNSFNEYLNYVKEKFNVKLSEYVIINHYEIIEEIH